MYANGGSSDAIAREMSSLLHSSTFKYPSDGKFGNFKELNTSDSFSNYNHHGHNGNHGRNQNAIQNQNQQRHERSRQTESSLMRYRSAPSSFYANLLDESECDDFFAAVETSAILESDSNDFGQYASSPKSMKLEAREEVIQKIDLLPESSAMYGDSSQQMPHNTNGSYNHSNHNNSGCSSTLRTMNSTNSNLIRQSSSPAGFLSSLNAETGFSGMRDLEKTISLNNHISFKSMPSSSLTFLPQPAENKELNDSTFRSLKRTRDGDSKMFSRSMTLDIENGEHEHYSPSLIHHRSLPKTSFEMAVAEKYLQFDQDSTPCKIRAKRGCATHPRSIAERVRRTRISERMKKIQALFPNMDKQTSTADMLDLSVQYIKDLQNELKTLNDARARCTCSRKQ